MRPGTIMDRFLENASAKDIQIMEEEADKRFINQDETIVILKDKIEGLKKRLEAYGWKAIWSKEAKTIKSRINCLETQLNLKTKEIQDNLKEEKEGDKYYSYLEIQESVIIEKWENDKNKAREERLLIKHGPNKRFEDERTWKIIAYDYIKNANELLSKNKFSEALCEYENAEMTIKMEMPFSFYYGKGMCYYHNNDYENAEKAFKEAVRIKSNEESAVIGEALSLIKLLEPEKALSILNTFLLSNKSAKAIDIKNELVSIGVQDYLMID